MRIAILTAGDSADTGGIMSFVCEEARQLRKRQGDGINSDVFMIRIKPSFILKKALSVFSNKAILKSCYDERPSNCIDGVVFHNIWVKENLLGFFIRTKITHKAFTNKNTKIICSVLRDYEYVITHKPQCHFIGCELWEQCRIPFGAFWHGSELAINALSSRESKTQAKKTLETAHDNFFVSEALLKMSDSITEKGRKKVIYTGPSDAFYCYTKEKKTDLRARFGVTPDTIVLAYVGHVIDLKNVMLLPQIYECIKAKCQNKKMVFWVLGHGVLEEPLKAAFEETSFPYKMFGNVPPSEMPDYMNCIDILLLISKKEGLGLVCLEAIKCGAKVFGSKVGGIPEVIGVSNCTSLDSSFIDNISTLIANYIQEEKRSVTYDELFSWENAVNSILESIEE